MVPTLSAQRARCSFTTCANFVVALVHGIIDRVFVFATLVAVSSICRHVSLCLLRKTYKNKENTITGMRSATVKARAINTLFF